jgi:serine/threonine-protein kinase
VDARTDLWSLGVILFELCTAKRPFDAGTVPELCAAILTATPKRLREVRPELPEGLEAVVTRCMKKDVEDRYASIGDLAAALAPFAPSHVAMHLDRITRLVPPRREEPSTNRPQAARTVTADAFEDTAALDTAPPRRSPVPVAAIALVVLALGGGLAWRLTRPEPSATGAPTASPLATPLPQPTTAATAPAPTVTPVSASASAAEPAASAAPSATAAPSTTARVAAPTRTAKAVDAPAPAPTSAPRAPAGGTDDFGGRK